MDIIIVAEDELSLSALRRLVAEERGRLNIIEPAICAGGAGNIQASLQKYRNASKIYPHFILTDLDSIHCPIALLESWGMQEIPDNMAVRIAIRETEAWLLADQKGLADFLLVPSTKIPARPEEEQDPKRCLINLARKSRSKRLAAEIAPQAGSRAIYGPLYNARLCQFVAQHWNVERASHHAPSLMRTLRKLSTFMQKTQPG